MTSLYLQIVTYKKNNKYKNIHRRKSEQLKTNYMHLHPDYLILVENKTLTKLRENLKHRMK